MVLIERLEDGVTFEGPQHGGVNGTYERIPIYLSPDHSSDEEAEEEAEEEADETAESEAADRVARRMMWVEWLPESEAAKGVPRLKLHWTDTWYWCEWCGWKGYFASNPDAVPTKYKLAYRLDFKSDHARLLCMRCHDLNEPPWYPNKRERCHEWLLQVFRKSALACTTLRQVAEYLAENEA